MCTIALGFLCTWGNFIKPVKNRFMQQCITFVLCNYSNLEFLYYKTVTWKFDIKKNCRDGWKKSTSQIKWTFSDVYQVVFFHLWVDFCGAVLPVTLSAYNIWYGYRSLRNARVIRHFFYKIKWLFTILMSYTCIRQNNYSNVKLLKLYN